MNDLIQKKISEIEGELDRYNGSEISLYGGSTGIAIFYAHLYQLTKKKSHLKKSRTLIMDAIDRLQNTEIIHTLAGGFTGIAWGVNYLADMGVIKEDKEILFEELDDYVYLAGARDLNMGEYDFLHGGTGPVLFSLHRLPHENARRFLEYAVKQIDRLKIEDEFGIKWVDHRRPTSPFMPKLKEGVTSYNFGMAHGIPSILYILVKIYIKGFLQKETSELIRKGIDWMIHHGNKDPGSLSLYPSALDDGDPNANPFSRLSWCYGDLSIAWLFWKAGKSMNVQRWMDEAMRIMRHSLLRIDPLQNQNLDAAICHGTCGISHLFHKFYLETNQIEFFERATFWIDETLKQSKFADGLGGYKCFHPKSEKVWENAYGFLEGVAGIGLVYISYLDGKTGWDECLLLS